MSVVLLSRLSYCHAQKRPFLPPIQKSGSYPTYDGESDCRATWSECGDTEQIISAEGKSEGDIITMKGVVRVEKYLKIGQ